jgi:hypothetical protein
MTIHNQYTRYYLKMSALVTSIIMLILFATLAQASTLISSIPPNLREHPAIRSIVGEASGEGYEGMLAVACAIRNRGTLKGVKGINGAQVDSQPQWVWHDAQLAWEESKLIDVVEGATHWESTDFAKPWWAPRMQEVKKVGKHIFYIKKEGRK